MSRLDTMSRRDLHKQWKLACARRFMREMIVSYDDRRNLKRMALIRLIMADTTANDVKRLDLIQAVIELS